MISKVYSLFKAYLVKIMGKAVSEYSKSHTEKRKKGKNVEMGDTGKKRGKSREIHTVMKKEQHNPN